MPAACYADVVGAGGRRGDGEKKGRRGGRVRGDGEVEGGGGGGGGGEGEKRGGRVRFQEQYWFMKL